MKKIGIIGSGIVAKTLGDGFLKHNYKVMLGSRDESKLNEWKAKGGSHATTGSFADAALFGDIVVLAVKGKRSCECNRRGRPPEPTGENCYRYYKPHS